MRHWSGVRIAARYAQHHCARSPHRSPASRPCSKAMKPTTGTMYSSSAINPPISVATREMTERADASEASDAPTNAWPAPQPYRTAPAQNMPSARNGTSAAPTTVIISRMMSTGVNNTARTDASAVCAGLSSNVVTQRCRLSSNITRQHDIQTQEAEPPATTPRSTRWTRTPAAGRTAGACSNQAFSHFESAEVLAKRNLLLADRAPTAAGSRVMVPPTETMLAVARWLWDRACTLPIIATTSLPTSAVHIHVAKHRDDGVAHRAGGRCSYRRPRPTASPTSPAGRCRAEDWKSPHRRSRRPASDGVVADVDDDVVAVMPCGTPMDAFLDARIGVVALALGAFDLDPRLARGLGLRRRCRRWCGCSSAAIRRVRAADTGEHRDQHPFDETNDSYVTPRRPR